MPVKLGNNNLTFSGISEIYVGSNKVYSATPPGPPIIDNPVNEYFCVYSAKSFTIRFETINTASGASATLNYNNLKLKYSTNKTTWTEVSAAQGFNFNGGTLYYIYTSSAEVGTFVHNSDLGRSSASWGQVCCAPAYGYYSYTSTRMKFSGTSTIYLMGNIRTIAQGNQATPYNSYVGSKTKIDYVGSSVYSSSYSMYYTRACGLGSSTYQSSSSSYTPQYLRARGISNIQGTSNSRIDINNLFIGDHEELSYPSFTYATGTPYTPPYDPSEDYFYVENLTSSANTLSITKSNASAPTITIYRSTDKNSWTSMGSTSTTALTYSIPANSKIYLKATADSWGTPAYYNNIICSNNFAVGGNTMSLLYGDSFIGKTVFPSSSSTSILFRLFNNSTNLKNIDNLVLPATTLNNYCYGYMFGGCTGLTTLPSNLLPATTLNNQCYSGMFYNCTGLTTVPSNLLPATTLTSSCYQSMFNNCTSLTNVPNLPATTLASSCYSNMFSSCRGLTSIPSNLLPATTLAQSCYSQMFSSCRGLTNVPNLPATRLASSCYSSMFSSCTGLTTIPSNLLPSTTLANHCYQSMFNNCTSLTTAPELPATTLISYCYMQMFSSCTSLTTAPDLPATRLASSCYSSMFRNCSSLNEITCYANDISATNCTNSWVSGVASSGTFYKRGDAAWTTGNNGIPTGWTVIDDRPYNPINDYFWIENRKSSSDTIRFTFITNSASSNYSPALSSNSYFFYYSTDKSTWTPHTATNLTIPANTRYYFYSNQNGGYNQRDGDISSGKAIPYFDSFGGIMAAASINGSFQPTLYANMGFGGNASSNFAIGGNIRTLLGKGTGGVGDTSLLERGSKQSISTDSRNQCRYLVYTALGTASTSFSNYAKDLGLFFTGITDAGNLYIGNSDHEAEFSLITPTTLPIYT